MNKPISELPLIRNIIQVGKKIQIPGLSGMSLYSVLKMYLIGIVKGAFTSRASGIAFSFFMALFPFLLFILTLIPYVPMEGFQKDFMFMIEQLLPPNTADSVYPVVNDIANNRYAGLLSFGFFVSVFLMTNGVNSILSAFEYSYHVSEMRSVVKQYLISLLLALFLSFVLLFTVMIMVYYEIGVQKLKVNGWLEDANFWIEKGRSLFFIGLLFISVSSMYKFGAKEVKGVSFISPGSILTTLLWLVMFQLFSVYVERFATYNQLYGSIGTLLILMLFVWLNSIILLLGFELNASISKLRKFGRDKQ